MLSTGPSAAALPHSSHRLLAHGPQGRQPHRDVWGGGDFAAGPQPSTHGASRALKQFPAHDPPTGLAGWSKEPIVQREAGIGL